MTIKIVIMIIEVIAIMTDAQLPWIIIIINCV